mmetsp:Transcript_26247/g.40685  ORF Transcript_26247/g.40685 Transcript_26247/m.40685 type:complete len:94 (-) Transcript_26247:687-968(-)
MPRKLLTGVYQCGSRVEISEVFSRGLQMHNSCLVSKSRMMHTIATLICGSAVYVIVNLIHATPYSSTSIVERTTVEETTHVSSAEQDFRVCTL